MTSIVTYQARFGAISSYLVVLLEDLGGSNSEVGERSV